MCNGSLWNNTNGLHASMPKDQSLSFHLWPLLPQILLPGESTIPHSSHCILTALRLMLKGRCSRTKQHSSRRTTEVWCPSSLAGPIGQIENNIRIYEHDAVSLLSHLDPSAAEVCAQMRLQYPMFLLSYLTLTKRWWHSPVLGVEHESRQSPLLVSAGLSLKNRPEMATHARTPPAAFRPNLGQISLDGYQKRCSANRLYMQSFLSSSSPWILRLWKGGPLRNQFIKHTSQHN